MANAFASSYKVNIKEGNTWNLNVGTKTLEYDPDTLTNETKNTVIALLLHEIGHLLHTKPVAYTDSKWLKKYPRSAGEIVNLFEDFRIDTIMRKSYAGAKDVYTSFEAIKNEIATSYQGKKEKLAGLIIDLMHTILESKVKGSEQEYFGTEDQQKINEKVQLIKAKLERRKLFMEYCAGICVYPRRLVYSEQSTQERIQKTAHAIPLAENAKSTKHILRIAEQEVYPIIKDILEENTDEEEQEELRKMGGKIAEWIADRLADIFNIRNTSNNYSNKVSPQAKIQKGDGAGGLCRERKSWQTGDYANIKSSMREPIAALQRKIVHLKRQESTPHFEPAVRSGSFDAKQAYKHRLNNTKLFKRKTEKNEVITSYAFYFAVDTSGSMSEDRIGYATQSAVILAEVFDKAKIPFSINTFDDNHKRVKGFSDGMTQKIKSSIAGIPQSVGGGTDFMNLLRRITFEGRKERNKIVILLSDGGVDNFLECQEKIKTFAKENIKTIGIGLQCGGSITQLCNGNGIEISEPQKLPDIFMGLIKNLLIKK
jgi:predicted metal-dependent peptidase